MDPVVLLHGDSRERLKELADNSIDAIVTDPPYELALFDLEWDSSGVAVDPDLWAECLRVLKPGGHLIAFTAARIYHRVAYTVEKAGFDIRDQIMWVYASGFPKSMDVSAAIDKMKANREQVLQITRFLRESRDAAGLSNREIDAHMGFVGMAGHWTTDKTQPQCPTREQWGDLIEFLGCEVPPEIQDLVDEVIADKGQPGQAWLDREVVGVHEQPPALGVHAGAQSVGEIRPIPTTELAARYLGWGTQLKPCHEPCILARKPLIGTVAQNIKAHGTGALNIDGCRVGDDGGTTRSHQADDHAENSGWTTGHGVVQLDKGRWPANMIADEEAAEMLAGPRFGGFAGAAKVFYCPKPMGEERGENLHPTLKPIELMRYLVRLVTPVGGRVLDPFMGSGTTGIAARLEGMEFTGIELTEEFYAYAQKRMEKHIVGQPASMTQWFV